MITMLNKSHVVVVDVITALFLTIMQAAFSITVLFFNTYLITRKCECKFFWLSEAVSLPALEMQLC